MISMETTKNKEQGDCGGTCVVWTTGFRGWAWGNYDTASRNVCWLEQKKRTCRFVNELQKAKLLPANTFDAGPAAALKHCIHENTEILLHHETGSRLELSFPNALMPDTQTQTHTHEHKI
jgi:hypothetical protein